MSGDDVTALANELRFTLRLGLIQPDSVARSILASAWRIQRDARIKAEALREAAADRPALQQVLCAEDDRHFAAGSSHGAGPDVSCDVFEDWLRERADRLDGGAR